MLAARNMRERPGTDCSRQPWERILDLYPSTVREQTSVVWSLSIGGSLCAALETNGLLSPVFTCHSSLHPPYNYQSFFLNYKVALVI